VTLAQREGGSTLQLLSGGAAQGIVGAIEEDFRLATAARVQGTFGAVGAMRDKLLAGAPCDAIILTAAGDAIPHAVLDQLSPTGVLVAPVGSPSNQTLIRMRGDGQGDFIQEELAAVSFVPLLGGIG